jgi:hypothetical protein
MIATPLTYQGCAEGGTGSDKYQHERHPIPIPKVGKTASAAAAVASGDVKCGDGRLLPIPIRTTYPPPRQPAAAWRS